MEERRNNMEKLKVGKHDHKLTNWLKVIIFGCVMLAPVFSVVSKCLYVACNKNAFQSYSDKSYTIQNKITLTNLTDVINTQQYTLNTSNVDFTGTYNQTSYLIEYEQANWTTPNNAKYFTIGGSIGHASNYSMTYYDESKNYISFTRLTEANTYTFILVSTETNGSYFTNSLFGAELETYQYIVETNKLDNAFQYAVEQIPNEQIFAWTKNTGIYTPINAMCNGLGFNAQNNVLAVLLTYWMLCTCVYIVIDIVIACFTKLTHIFGND